MNVQKVNYRNPNAASDFTKSLKHTGFSVITNHPIEKSLIDSIFSSKISTLSGFAYIGV